MAAARQPRFPLAPVWRQGELAWGLAALDRYRGGRGSDRPFSGMVLAEQLGVDHRQVERWKAEGLTLTAADRVACQLGLTVHLLWPAEYEALELEGSVAA